MKTHEPVAKHLLKIRELATSNQIDWKIAEVPKPASMRSFNGITPEYNILVCQANVEGAGIVHEGMAIIIDPDGPIIMRMTSELADHLYHLAVAKLN